MSHISSDLIEIEEGKKTLSEMKQRLDQLKQEALPGKCPILFPEIESQKIDWDKLILRKPYKTWKDALKHLTATTDADIAGEIFTRGLSALPGNNVAKNANLTAQTLADASPQDSTEARLTLQANALYSQGMAHLYRAEQEHVIIQCEFYLKNAMKLLRLHNETVEALCKYKRRGEQRIIVQHVNIEGQAIVNNGNMIARGGCK